MEEYRKELSEAIIRCIFSPGTKVMVFGKNFRKTRQVATDIDNFFEKIKARSLYEFRKSSDRWELSFKNGSRITALPFPNEYLCGYRANILVLVDSKDFTPDDYTQVLPFISVNIDPKSGHSDNMLIKL